MYNWVPSSVKLSPKEFKSGNIVQYIGRLNGGPTYGTHGIIKRILGQKAIVDLGMLGQWTIPCNFLGHTITGMEQIMPTGMIS